MLILYSMLSSLALEISRVNFQSLIESSPYSIEPPSKYLRHECKERQGDVQPWTFCEIPHLDSCSRLKRISIIRPYT